MLEDGDAEFARGFPRVIDPVGERCGDFRQAAAEDGVVEILHERERLRGLVLRLHHQFSRAGHITVEGGEHDEAAPTLDLHVAGRDGERFRCRALHCFRFFQGLRPGAQRPERGCH